jgi:hypothetical protein
MTNKKQSFVTTRLECVHVQSIVHCFPGTVQQHFKSKCVSTRLATVLSAVNTGDFLFIPVLSSHRAQLLFLC